MDSSFWDNVGTVKQQTTKKMFFGRYLWRLEYDAVGASMVNDKSIEDIHKYVKFIQDNVKDQTNTLGGYSYRYDPWGYANRGKLRLANADPYVLSQFRIVRDLWDDRIKTRGEHDCYQWYTETEDDAKDIVSQLKYNSGLRTVTGPVAGTEAALRAGTIYMGKGITHRYKVFLRDGSYDRNTKRSIWAQLHAYGDEVRVPESTFRLLNSGFSAIWGAYFYTNDLGIATMLALIEPKIVGKIHPIERLNK
jgi:hypothetical protein